MIHVLLLSALLTMTEAIFNDDYIDGMKTVPGKNFASMLHRLRLIRDEIK
jgi:hypothetical protein